MLTLSICPLYFPGLQAISHSARLRRLCRRAEGRLLSRYDQARFSLSPIPCGDGSALPCPSLPSAQLDKSDSLQSDLALPPFPPILPSSIYHGTTKVHITRKTLCLTHTCPRTVLRSFSVFSIACKYLRKLTAFVWPSPMSLQNESTILSTS